MRAVGILAVALATAAAAFAQPAAPTGLEASDSTYTRKTGLSWEHVRGADVYEVLRSETGDSAAAEVIGATVSIIYYDASGTAGQTYTYWVRGVGTDGTGPLSAPDEGTRAVGREVFSGFFVPLEPPPAPPENPVTAAKAYLGKALFWEEQLSSTRTVACGTCHQPKFGGSDPRSALNPELSTHPGPDGSFGTEDDIIGSPGVPLNFADGTYGWSDAFGLGLQVTSRKAQSAIDAAYSELQFWDGRADESLIDPLTNEVVIEDGAALENQALHPLVSDVEMSSVDRGWAEIVARLAVSSPLGLSPSMPPALATWIGDRGYPELFEEAFGTPEITPARIGMAIATYERTLYSDRTPFDQAISELREMGAAERRGNNLFARDDCRLCHFPAEFADGLFHNIGVRPEAEDRGRFDVTGVLSEDAEFKTPSLLNSALRAPFMHNGRLQDVGQVVDFYDRGGDTNAPNIPVLIRPRNLSSDERAALIAFLTNELTDPRVASAAAPLFDRPMLYAESARVPELIESGSSGFEGKTPGVVAIEPPFAGNPNFTVGLHDARPGATATLVVDESSPSDSFLFAVAEADQVFEATVSADGHASVVLRLPATPGEELFGRWYVTDSDAADGVARSQTFQASLFDAGAATAEPATLTSVSSASFAVGMVAPESLVSGFGAGMGSFEAFASLPLPTSLGGLSLVVRDAAGVERLARLLYASATQVNFEVPAGTPSGEADVVVYRQGVEVARGTLQIGEVGPGLFTADSSGSGPAAAFAIRVLEDGAQVTEPVAIYDAQAQEFATAPIDMDADAVFLSLFGTGIRNAQVVEATVRGVAAEVAYFGAHTQFAGLDQVNVRIPASLTGAGVVEVRLVVDGLASNVVRVELQ